jgi:uncharacterized membrane protein
MSRGRLALTIFILTIVGAFAHQAYYAAQLPANVASHFNGAGVPNGWMSRQVFLLFNDGLVAFLAVVFLIMGQILYWAPDSIVNLPHKEYWLAPERWAETCAYFRDWSYGFGAATITFITGVMHLVFRFNLGLDPKLNPAIKWLLVVFLIDAGLMVAVLFWRFRRVPVAAASGQASVNDGRERT